MNNNECKSLRGDERERSYSSEKNEKDLAQLGRLPDGIIRFIEHEHMIF
jgi:hypothetical protein